MSGDQKDTKRMTKPRLPPKRGFKNKKISEVIVNGDRGSVSVKRNDNITTKDDNDIGDSGESI
ncbi:hypothetical protein M5K25_015416 [Dendrobium thyrsiflorum]|uniref:Uncharacterized protein n=1 Tax=Dendrobium thyrsiflorum TaxID=117978 RepID=A0ABD0UQ71_DENTH